MINYLGNKANSTRGEKMSKKARKIAAWIMVILMVGSVVATIVSYALA